MFPKTSENLVPVSSKLQPHQEELQHLGEMAGIHMDAKVFRMLVELLNMGVDPSIIFNILKSIRRGPSKQSRSSLSQVTR